MDGTARATSSLHSCCVSILRDICVSNWQRLILAIENTNSFSALLVNHVGWTEDCCIQELRLRTSSSSTYTPLNTSESWTLWVSCWIVLRARSTNTSGMSL